MGHTLGEERRRLADSYARMTDEELTELAREAASLTEVAREVLEDELDRRHLDIEPVEPAAPGQLQYREMVTVRQFGDLSAALLAKGALDAAGIESFLSNENVARIAWSALVGGLQLRVNPEDFRAALDVLEHQEIPEDDSQHE